MKHQDVRTKMSKIKKTKLGKLRKHVKIYTKFSK